jgi:hypothetical protein
MSSTTVFFAQPLSKSKSDSSKILDSQSPAEIVKDSLLASSPSLSSPKDLRAYEHDRQRVKKAADLVKMRARKGQGWTSKLHDSKKDSGAGLPSEKGKRLTDEEVDSLEGVIALGDSRGDLRDEVVSSDLRSEVKLADLVTSRKSRKGQGMHFSFFPYSSVLNLRWGVAEGDFEVIPHIRSVIVLDDIVSQDLVIDEPWEHIYGNDEEDASAKGLSYAKVLSVPAK